ncbi:MAG: ribose 5-phosphate isomerase B [Firmicutes bacterium]|nr:ribose 5-phosphate isomerase B [Bacillota bacterium]
MRIAVGSDEVGFDLKEMLKEYLKQSGVECEDLGPADRAPVLYPEVAARVAEAIRGGAFDRGLLVCGTGIGMAISANKVPGIRAACCHDTYSAERARKSNNAQIITMGARVIGPDLAKSVLAAWLESEFAGGSSAPKVAAIDELDRKYRKTRGEMSMAENG